MNVVLLFCQQIPLRPTHLKSDFNESNSCSPKIDVTMYRSCLQVKVKNQRLYVSVSLK